MEIEIEQKKLVIKISPGPGQTEAQCNELILSIITCEAFKNTTDFEIENVGFYLSDTLQRLITSYIMRDRAFTYNVKEK